MDVKARVVRVEGKLMGEVTRPDACGHCQACDHGRSEKRHYPLPEGEWKEGDEITLSIGEGRAFAASVLGYGVPLAGLLLGLFLPSLLELGEIAQIVGALIGLGAGYLVLKKLEPVFKRSGRYAPKCEQLQKETKDEKHEDDREATMGIKHFSSGEVTPQALSDKGVVLIDFWAPWCGPCRMVGPIVEELATAYAGRAIVGKVNVDEENEAAAAYRVYSIPTLVLFKDGVEKERMVGAQSRQALQALLDKHLA